MPVITGPTGAGKSDLALRLARLWDAEIVSADSRQIYCKMDVGTAKPSREELDAVPHHLIDERWPNEGISAGAFARIAWARIADIHERGKTAIIVGGSTLYIKAVTEGIADLPPANLTIRAELTERLKREGSESLYDELKRIDPASATTMDATKTQRIVRAIEVYESTGRPLSELHQLHVPPPFSFNKVVLTMNRQRLYDRIESRVESMMRQGLVQEVMRLLEEYGRSAAPLSTIGYKEIIEYLEGVHDVDEAVRLIKRNTRRYAKRQLTWFRQASGYQWVDAEVSPLQTMIRIFDRRSGDVPA